MSPGPRNIRRKNNVAARLPVDASKLIMGNTCGPAPEYYYDIEFDLMEYGVTEIWDADQQ